VTSSINSSSSVFKMPGPTYLIRERQKQGVGSSTDIITDKRMGTNGWAKVGSGR
jgi:hypothetical protein